ncbi:MAG: hypothetical protein LBK73_04180 [Treponema sp.]|nr:hypothetical protein [Treponema sp.]
MRGFFARHNGLLSAIFSQACAGYSSGFLANLHHERRGREADAMRTAPSLHRTPAEHSALQNRP